MKNHIKGLRYIFLTLTVILLSTSCSLAKLSKIGRQIEVVKVANVEVKGMTGIRLDVELINGSQHALSMNEASITLKLEGEEVATLTQIGEATAPAGSQEVVSTLWRIDSADAITLFMLMAKVTKRDLSGLSIDFSADISAMGNTHTLTGKDVDISNLMESVAF